MAWGDNVYSWGWTWKLTAPASCGSLSPPPHAPYPDDTNASLRSLRLWRGRLPGGGGNRVRDLLLRNLQARIGFVGHGVDRRHPLVADHARSRFPLEIVPARVSPLLRLLRHAAPVAGGRGRGHRRDRRRVAGSAGPHHRRSRKLSRRPAFLGRHIDQVKG